MSQPWEYIAKIVSLGDSGCGKSSLTIRLCEGRFSPHHDVTIGVEFGSRIVPVGPPASDALGINNPAGETPSKTTETTNPSSSSSSPSSQQNGTPPKPTPTSRKPPLKSSATSSPTSAHDQKQKHMKLSLWDTAGQETYRSITRSYFRGASGALLVFDITRRSTFNSVTAWLNDLRQIAEDEIIIVLVGNKSDLAPASTVPSSSAAEDHPAAASNTKNKREVTSAEAEAWCRANKVLQYVETSAKSGEGVERAFREVAERIYQNIEAGRYDLNDRRSGVKSAAAGGGGNTARTVNLGMNDAAAAGGGQRKGGGGCC